jgi:hypothetical protein
MSFAFVVVNDPLIAEVLADLLLLTELSSTEDVAAPVISYTTRLQRPPGEALKDHKALIAVTAGALGAKDIKAREDVLCEL